MNVKLAATLAAVLAVLCHARVAIAPGLAVPVPALAAAALVAALGVLGWVAIRAMRGFRSRPHWRPVTERTCPS